MSVAASEAARFQEKQPVTHKLPLRYRRFFSVAPAVGGLRSLGRATIWNWNRIVRNYSPWDDPRCMGSGPLHRRPVSRSRSDGCRRHRSDAYTSNPSGSICLSTFWCGSSCSSRPAEAFRVARTVLINRFLSLETLSFGKPCDVAVALAVSFRSPSVDPYVIVQANSLCVMELSRPADTLRLCGRRIRRPAQPLYKWSLLDAVPTITQSRRSQAARTARFRCEALVATTSISATRRHHRREVSSICALAPGVG
ncbi:hypothetical protein J2Z31_005945 [Sinorhizobium kostiense]|uniref:Transposase n=1 Tax=Sinorhizobium kostiense TaxID=76747 RepID=A0ABS4R919_9HYPH|nr:hypothetical protein [Sinorhizobium kostiense]